jgi:polyhydroxyalkanoate synthesis regulator protein
MPEVTNVEKIAKDGNGSEAEPILIKFHRHRYADWAVLFDPELEFRSLEELRDWAARKIAFVVIDTETGEDITRILLA